MKFVDRTDETARLKEALSGERSTLVVIYGRRRLGKSTVIKRALTEDDVYFLADRSEGQHQRSMLAKVVGQLFPDFDKLTYPDWEALLRAINYRTINRFTLCLDEFPYLVEQSPELPSVLQKLIDEKTLKYNIVVCGSSQNMMYGLFLGSTAPLYGRADVIMKFMPIRLPYIQEALGFNATSAIEEYSVWGGVPRYWELRENNASLKDALWYNILSVNGTLYEEPIKLFQDDVKDVAKTSTIMSYVGSGASRLSEIASRCNEPATNLSRPLKKLIDLGFLEREVPFGVDEKSSKKSLYKIADPFMAFYYQFVVPNRSFIELGRRRPIEQALNTHFSEYVSMQWERICRNTVTGNQINGVLYDKANRWWGSVLNEEHKPEQVEIDVMAESLDKKYLLVGECKWTTQENGKLLTTELLRKANLLPFAKNYTIIPVLFLKNKPQNDVKNTILPDDIIKLAE
ncbi:ATP-binding protein [Alistipes sp. An66]|uniref:ATP-binding protein n=1 Tax=Alistipes sp. An66 TaxID=1965650 RepID=UPI000B3AD30F|nr:ATP-binding protein [Alistipes sp. An66]OUN55780.1 ATP-binding protein [Alistipes sp. An66]